MNRIAAAGALALALCVPSVCATVQRTFVASTGNDSNPCSLNQPCRSFTAAIAHTNAGGEVIVQDSAGYGPVTIPKSVSIMAPNGIYAGITVTSGDGVTVSAPGATVVLRGLSINGQGGDKGIRLDQATRLRIESCIVSNMSSAGILHGAATAEMIVLDTIVRDNAGHGIAVFSADASIVVDHVRIEHNSSDGIFIFPAPGSINATAAIVESVVINNGANGVNVMTALNTTTSTQVDRSTLANNGGHGFLANSTGSAVAVLSRNAIKDNGGNGISMEGTISGAVSGNTLAHNHGIGVSVFAASPLAARVDLVGNVFGYDNGGAMYARGAGAIVTANANTATLVAGFDLECFQNALIITFGNNAIQNISTSSCNAILEALK